MPDVSLNGIEFKIKGSSDAASDSIDKLIGKLNDLQSALKQTAGIKQMEMGMSSIRTSVAKNVSTWNRFKSALGNVGKLIKGVSFPVRSAASSIKGFAEKIGSVAAGFKRILGYRMIRAIIKDISKAMEEGAKAAYLFSKNLGDKTKYISKMLDGLSASSKSLGGQMGAAWATLLAAITPIINQIISIISTAIQVITQFFALLGRSGFYLKAKQGTSDWADETARGAGAAKEWKNQLMGFDELNRLNDPGGGGGGGGNAADYASMFEEVPVAQGVKDFFNSLKEAFDAENWQQLGTLIGDKINEVVNSIDWAGIGFWIGEKINALFSMTYWTLKSINFQNIGEKVAEFLTGDNGIGGALRSIDFTNLGGIIAEKITILPDMILGFVRKLDWSAVGKSIGDTIAGFFNNLSDWVSGINFGEVVQTLIDGIISFVKGYDSSGVAGAFINLAINVAKAVADSLAGILGAIVDGIVNFFSADGAWGKLKNTIITKVNGIITNINQYLPEWLQIPTIPVPIEPEIDDTSGAFDNLKKALEAQSANNPVNVNTTAVLNKAKNTLTGENKPKVNSYAAFNAVKNGLTGSKKPSIGTNASLNNVIISGGLADSNGYMKIKSTAQITKVSIGYTPTIDVTARVRQTQAKGGVFTGGGWKSITSYASGGSPFGGQIFRARENGNPELVGTIHGSTAVMNNDQIVASVASGVQKAIAGIHFQLAGFGTPVAVDTDNGENEETMYRAFRRALNETDFGGDIELDGDVIYRAMVRRNRNNTRMTGVNAMA